MYVCVCVVEHCSLSDMEVERLHYVGTAFGVTQQLYNFWGKLGFVPVYLRQTASSVTGEHTCIMIKVDVM